MCPKMIIFDHASPMRIDHDGALVRRPDAIFPMVLVGEAPARPAQDRYLNGLECGHDVVPNAARIGNRALRPHPKPLVNTVPEVLGELAVNISVDGRTR